MSDGAAAVAPFPKRDCAVVVAALLVLLGAVAGVLLEMQDTRRKARMRLRDADRQRLIRLSEVAALLDDGQGPAARRLLGDIEPRPDDWAWRHLTARASPATGTNPQVLAGNSVVQGLTFGRSDHELGVLTGGVLTAWDTRSDASRTGPPAFDGGRTLVASRDGTRWFVVDDHSVHVVDSNTLAVLAARRVERLGRAARDVAPSPDGRQLAAALNRGGLGLWDATTLEDVARPVTLRASVKHVRWSPDGRWLATGDRMGRTVLLSAANRAIHESTRRYPGHARELTGVLDLAFDAKSERLAIAFGSGRVEVRRIPSFDLECTLHADARAALAVAFSPDGSRLATGGEDGVLKLWEPPSKIAKAHLPGHGGAIVAVAFSADGTRIATASADGTTRVWDSASR